MTPEEAIEKLVAAGFIVGEDPNVLTLLFDAVKATETRRGAARVKAVATLIERETLPKVHDAEIKGLVQNIIDIVSSLANDLLTTGGLEAEE